MDEHVITIVELQLAPINSVSDCSQSSLQLHLLHVSFPHQATCFQIHTRETHTTINWSTESIYSQSHLQAKTPTHPEQHKAAVCLLFWVYT